MKAVILTGTSNGLGKSLFDQLSKQEDVFLYCIARRFLPEQESLAQLPDSRIRLWLADLSVDQLPSVEECTRFLSTFDFTEVILIHNAGMLEPIGAVGALASSKVTEALQVNLTSPILLTNALLAAIGPTIPMQLKILYISSGAAKRPKDGWAVYCASKAGGEMFFKVLQEQYAGHKMVSIINFDPGVMDTSMQEMIRKSTHVHFPQRERFIAMKEEGVLVPPEVMAERIIKEHIAIEE